MVEHHVDLFASELESEQLVQETERSGHYTASSNTSHLRDEERDSMVTLTATARQVSLESITLSCQLPIIHNCQSPDIISCSVMCRMSLL